MQLVEWAEETARDRLAEALPRRWSHVQAVARRAGQLSEALGEDGELLRAAAWLHDVGYAPELATTGFHPLDGARYLVGADVTERLVGLVAMHSSAAAEAELFGVADQLAEFSDERTLTRDLLWWCDMTIGPDGQCMTFAERMGDVRARYGPDHYVTQALDRGMAERVGAVERAEAWIASVGLAGQV
ncbi:HD domain-containing protein [Pseudonocardia ailaonensis]|uniref:HD domain-containing protein n=1 Tax=Pseudonocardia ailaonensis TaxID=367279 RepID=UPI0031D8739A